MVLQKAIDYYNDYIDCTQNLPLDVQRHVTHMRECDLEYQEMLSKIHELTRNFDGTASSLNPGKLTKLLVTGLNLGDKKVQTVQQISDLVDDKVRRLEIGRKFLTSVKESDAPKLNLKEKSDSGSCSKERNIPNATSTSVTKELKKRNTDNDSNESNNEVKITKRPRRNRTDEPDYKEIPDDIVALSVLQHTHTPLPRATATAQIQSQVSLKKSNQKTDTKTKKKGKYKKQQKDNSPSLDDDDDIAVDPDEPTYCLCDQISYGEMICCDNDLCPIEWFHFSCVSLSTKPKGKWFCPKCRGDRPNVMKPKAQFLKELERYNKEKEDKA
ncbi:inhibitor of growth protein 1-like [Daktulosphaira vitifoliae]|uniref:inhibitor of growth protein 1-like n=1 Tax=Daktulosphaira vitifoliae TaxID=58002 RepID=UPI0021AACECC|nr:inhibitor of growth protein 1-like [Daktulosphaira vitifoliae]